MQHRYNRRGGGTRYQGKGAQGSSAKQMGMQFPKPIGAVPRYVRKRTGRSPMADNRAKRGTPDRSMISMEQEHEVRYWTRELGVSEAVLTAAVAKVGNSVDAVR